MLQRFRLWSGQFWVQIGYGWSTVRTFFLHTYTKVCCIIYLTTSVTLLNLLRLRICLSREVFNSFLWAASTCWLPSVNDHWGSGRAWAGCLTPRPQSERSVQLGWTPCLCWVTGGASAHLTQFHVIWVRIGQRLGSGGTEGSVETSHGSGDQSFPCACRTGVGIMSLGLKKWNDCLPFIKAFF